jgi:hypothetical protein
MSVRALAWAWSSSSDGLGDGESASVVVDSGGEASTGPDSAASDGGDGSVDGVVPGDEAVDVDDVSADDGSPEVVDSVDPADSVRGRPTDGHSRFPESVEVAEDDDRSGDDVVEGDERSGGEVSSVVPVVPVGSAVSSASGARPDFGWNWNLFPPQSGQPESISFEPSANVRPQLVHWWGIGVTSGRRAR